MSPEYAMLGQFSEKSDVFSFGIIVIEIITGKKNARSYESHHMDEGLMSHVSFLTFHIEYIFTHVIYHQIAPYLLFFPQPYNYLKLYTSTNYTLY